MAASSVAAMVAFTRAAHKSGGGVALPVPCVREGADASDASDSVGAIAAAGGLHDGLVISASSNAWRRR